jgi:hypothetical protein
MDKDWKIVGFAALFALIVAFTSVIVAGGFAGGNAGKAVVSEGVSSPRTVTR